jgi:hypothetical protein
MSERAMIMRAGVLLTAVAPVLAGCSLLFSSSPFDGVELPSPVVVGETPVAAPTASSAETQPPVAATQGPLPSSAELAALLGPEDFAAVGVQGAGPASFSDAGPGSVYAVYAGQSSAAGGIELDVFVLPSKDEAAAMVGDPGLAALDDDTKQSIGAEHATLDQGMPTNNGTSSYDVIWAQKGRLVFDLGIPSSPESRDQLLALAALVLERSQAYQ